MTDSLEGDKLKPDPQRPPGVPEDYEQVALQSPDGTLLVFWGRVVETRTPDGRKKLRIDGVIPEDDNPIP